MKRTVITILLIAFINVVGNTTSPFDLKNTDQVKTNLTEFVSALKNKDFKKEKEFLAENVVWKYKSRFALSRIIPADSSLAYIGYLDSIRFGDILVDTEEGYIMRTYYQEPGSPELKHRYAFHVNNEGLIDQVIYIPPITKEYFPNWTDEEFSGLVARLDTNKNYDLTDIRPDEYNFHSYSCGGVIPAVENIIAEDAVEEENDEESKEAIDEGRRRTRKAFPINSGIPFRRV